MNSTKQKLTIKLLIIFFALFHVSVSNAFDVPIYDFPIGAYSQNADDYISPSSENYSKSLLSSEYQRAQLDNFYNFYYASDAQGLSPWSEQLVRAVLPFIKNNVPHTLENFNNQTQTPENKHYAENFKEHNIAWWNSIKENMDLSAIANSQFNLNNRAIAVTNTYARILPDIAPDFFHASQAGQGFPFDNLQASAVWAGTPLYVVCLSKNKAWSLVITPDAYFAWVKSDDIAYVSPKFIKRWQKAARHNLVAVTQTEAIIQDSQQRFQLTGYIGSVFPMIHRNEQLTSILIPIKNEQHQAIIKLAMLNTNAASIMPLIASPQNMIQIINQLKNRPYGWGGRYLFNDCSQEVKSIFTPFGIWLPRNTTNQSQLRAVDLSKNTLDERLNTLKEKGHPLMTLIYIGGHVMLYIGNKNETAMSYQNVWGLAPTNHDKRYVIGQSLFLPILKQYPEKPDAVSLANKSTFKLIYLDLLNLKPTSAQNFANMFFIQRNN